MKQKLTVFLLIIYCCLLFSGIHSVSAATSGTCGDNLTWTLDDAGTLTISGIGAMTSWDYYSSTPWDSNRSNVEKVVIENGVTSIGEHAFRGCNSLTSINIPDSVTGIGHFAFEYCRSLTSVTIGDRVTSIGDGAFYDCLSLTSVTIGNSVTIIGDFAFEHCTSLTSITIGDSVTSIGEDAFFNCNRLTSVTIGNSVTSIGGYAFYGCTILTDAYYHGTEEEWNAISIGSGNIPLQSATKHYIVSVTLLNPDGTKYAKWTQPIGTALDVYKIPATEGVSISVYKDSAMTQEYDLDTMINEDTVLYVKVMAEIKAKLSEDKKQLQVQPFGISEGSKILVAFYQNGKFQQVQPETYKGEALFFPVNQAYTDIKIMAWKNFDTLKSLCVPEELPIQ